MDAKGNECTANVEHFKTNRLLLKFVGLWPFGSQSGRVVRQCVFMLLYSMLLPPNLLGAYMWCGKNLAECAHNISGLMIHGGVLFKYAIAIIKEKKMLKIYREMSKNWIVISDENERSILLKHDKLGKQRFQFYTIYVLVGLVCYDVLTALPIILDHVKPLNETRQRLLLVAGEFVVDPFDYYSEIYWAYCLLYVLASLTSLAVDGTYVALVHHNLGLVNVTKYRIMKAVNCTGARKVDAYGRLISAIEMHQEFIKFHDYLKDAYQLIFMGSICGSVMFISFLAVTTMEIADEIYVFIKMVMLELGILVYLFYQSWPGQLLIDECNDLFSVTYRNQWYEMSERTKTLIKIIMMRSRNPSFFSAGGFYIMNFENFGTFLKTAVSFITVLASFR